MSLCDFKGEKKIKLEDTVEKERLMIRLGLLVTEEPSFT